MPRLQWNWNWHTSTRGSFLLFRLCEKWAQLQFSCYVHSPNIEQMSLWGPVVCQTPHILFQRYHCFLLFPSSLKSGALALFQAPQAHCDAQPPETSSGTPAPIPPSILALSYSTYKNRSHTVMIFKKKTKFNEQLTMSRAPFGMERYVSQSSFLASRVDDLNKGMYSYSGWHSKSDMHEHLQIRTYNGFSPAADPWWP